jgi:hypothetical protein
MEHLWSLAGATSGNRWQMVWPQKRRNKPNPLPPVATSCRSERMVRRGQRFESVRGLRKGPANGPFSCPGTCRIILRFSPQVSPKICPRPRRRSLALALSAASGTAVHLLSREVRRECHGVSCSGGARRNSAVPNELEPQPAGDEVGRAAEHGQVVEEPAEEEGENVVRECEADQEREPAVRSTFSSCVPRIPCDGAAGREAGP